MASLSARLLAGNGSSIATPLLRGALLAVSGSLALYISAKIVVPLYPVPMTMQSLAVLLLGAAYGWRLGAATLMLYLAEAAIGVPVLAGGGGLAYMAGPTGGYLFGFVLAVLLCGWLAERGWMRRMPSALAAMLLGALVIDLSGLAWLATLTGWNASVLTVGLVPFIPGDLTKAALAAALAVSTHRFVRQAR